jgi:hypothetical protein
MSGRMTVVAGFGYKTSWLAVRNRTCAEVADALSLQSRAELDWADGTDRAYEYGVYVAAPLRGWVLAHGRRHLTAYGDASEPGFPDWLEQLSRALGEVQFFATDRISEYHAWARARDGDLLRGYCYVGERNEVALFRGDPTADERELGIGTRQTDPDCERWSDDEWDAWSDTTPSEGDVMEMAGRWSIDPSTIDDDMIPERGIHGIPVAVPFSAGIAIGG